MRARSTKAEERKNKKFLIIRLCVTGERRKEEKKTVVLPLQDFLLLFSKTVLVILRVSSSFEQRERKMPR